LPRLKDRAQPVRTLRFMNKISIAAPHGVYAALGSFVLMLAVYLIQSEWMVEWWVSLFSTALNVVFMFLACAAFRKVQGTATFGEAWTVSMLASGVAAVVGLLLSMLLFFVIDSSLPQMLVDLSIDQSREMMESFGMSGAMVDMQLDEAKRQVEEAFTPGGMAKNTIWSLAFWAVLSLVVAAVMKRAPKSDFT
jgi:branched-subunit amino acid ABC-type transport system permease component